MTARKAEYGKGHPNFLKYVKFIVEHPSYKGMPDVYLDDGTIQWEAPSNRMGGKFKDTHQRRREWWRKKASKIGIRPGSSEWISRTAKLIHPTKEKPCKNCGRVMEIRYAYPRQRILVRISSLRYVDEDFPLDPLEQITDLIVRLHDRYGAKVLEDLPAVLKTSVIEIPALGSDLKKWLHWINEEYIPAEPPTLSPGAMSNAPDRLDGFHSFNLCCRSKADRGRSKDNLKSYVTDRRVFEYWVEGDWIAANELMGIIRSHEDIAGSSCFNGHPGPCTADHIGPISLGFMHRPQFRLLCRACNSAKNNRMWPSDVAHLIGVEEGGEPVASWYVKDLWDIRKHDVVDEETALRLSKIMRDNRHTAMFLMERILKAKGLAFLASMLGLDHADYDVGFVNLRIEGYITVFDSIEYYGRTTKYANEQKARRIRIAFDSIREYTAKENRNAFIVLPQKAEAALIKVLQILREAPKEVKALDAMLKAALSSNSDEAIRDIIPNIPTKVGDVGCFTESHSLLEEAMGFVAKEFSSMWENERYVRTGGEEDDDFA